MILFCGCVFLRVSAINAIYACSFQDNFSIDFNGTVGEKCRRLMESFKHPLKVHDAAWLRKGCVNC